MFYHTTIEGHEDKQSWSRRSKANSLMLFYTHTTLTCMQLHAATPGIQDLCETATESIGIQIFTGDPCTYRPIIFSCYFETD